MPVDNVMLVEFIEKAGAEQQTPQPEKPWFSQEAPEAFHSCFLHKYWCPFYFAGNKIQRAATADHKLYALAFQKAQMVVNPVFLLDGAKCDKQIIRFEFLNPVENCLIMYRCERVRLVGRRISTNLNPVLLADFLNGPVITGRAASQQEQALVFQPGLFTGVVDQIRTADLAKVSQGMEKMRQKVGYLPVKCCMIIIDNLHEMGIPVRSGDKFSVHGHHEERRLWVVEYLAFFQAPKMDAAKIY